MPPIRNTGFIPKDTEEATPQDPFFILGIIFVVISIVVSIASYAAGMYYESDNESLKSNIKSVTSNFNEKTIVEMLNFYTKTVAVNGVLKQHTYPNSIFYTLESAVEDTVYFKKFSFTNREEKGYEVSLTGVAPNYKSVARQMDILKGDQYKSMFSNIDLKTVNSEQYGNLSFDITFGVNVSSKGKETIIRQSPPQDQIQTNTQRDIPTNPAQINAVPVNITPTSTPIKINATTTGTVKTTPNPISL